MKITLENLSLQYSGNTVVKELDLEIADGESLVLLGQSGCGKTSTMRCIAGLEQPSGGRITIGDTVVHDSERRVSVAPYKRNVGMVFQSYAVWPHRTVFENVGFSLKMKKVPKEEATKRVRKALAVVGLSDFETRGASQLSGGQMQRVALARSLVMQPSVLLLDEPLSNLDARLRERLRIELREIQLDLNLTTVYVTHDQIEAFALADRIALMQGGRIVQIGTPQEIYAAPSTKSIADFLGVGNIFPCTVTKNGNEHVATTDRPPGLAAGQRRPGRNRTDQPVPAGRGPAGVQGPIRRPDRARDLARPHRCRQLPGRHRPLPDHPGRRPRRRGHRHAAGR